MKRLFNRITSDIFAGRNIETYVVTLIALVVAIMSVIEDVVPLDLQMAAILAALALLVFKTSAPENTAPDLDDVLRDRQSYGNFRDFIQGGSEMMVYAPSAVNILGRSSDIEREVLRGGGTLRVIIQDPEQTSSINFLKDQLDQQFSHMLEDDIQRSLNFLGTLQRDKGNVSYRLMPYSPGFSLTIIDPDGREGRLILEMLGFNSTSIDDRMHIEIRREQSAYWFEYWTRQFEQMWNIARDPKADPAG